MQLGSNTSEFQQFMFLQSLGKSHCVEVAIRRRGIFERFIVFFFHVDFVESIVDCFNVSILDGDKVWFDERDVVGFFEHAHNAGVVDTRSKRGKEIREKGGMFLEVEVKGSVINLEICGFDNDLFEGVMFLILVYNYEMAVTQASTECSIMARTALSNSS